jgi:hypothetical protein
LSTNLNERSLISSSTIASVGFNGSVGLPDPALGDHKRADCK